MVCLHHPPVPMGSKWLDTVGLDNGDEFLASAGRSGRVRAAIFGHVHQDYDDVHDGIRLLATPSTCRQFLPAATSSRSTTGRRLTGASSCCADGSINAELIWVEDA